MTWSPRENSPNRTENKYVESFKPLLQRKTLIKQRMRLSQHGDNLDITPWEGGMNGSQKSIVVKPNLVKDVAESPKVGIKDKASYPSSMTILHTQQSDDGPTITTPDEKSHHLNINVLSKNKKYIDPPAFEHTSALSNIPKQQNPL